MSRRPGFFNPVLFIFRAVAETTPLISGTIKSTSGHPPRIAKPISPSLFLFPLHPPKNPFICASLLVRLHPNYKKTFWRGIECLVMYMT